MPGWARAYVRRVEALNRRIGRAAMYLLFAMMGILLWSSISKTFFVPSLWTLEMAQFTLVAYYMLGGPYSIQQGAHVRMDLLYDGWSPRRRASVDALTVLALIVYLGLLVYGGVGSTAYALGYFGQEPFAFFGDLAATAVTEGPAAAGAMTGFLEKSPTAWGPPMWPIKVVMVAAGILMLLQAVACLIRDIAVLRGASI